MTFRKGGMAHQPKPAGLLRSSLVAFLLLLSGCATGSSTPSSSTPVSGTTGAVSTQMPTGPIKHIVFFIKENRTFDNYFGTYPGANGATTAVDSQGMTVPLHHQADQIPDIDHSSQGPG